MARFDLDSYETVAQRLQRAHNDHPTLRVITELMHVQRDDAGRPQQYIVRAQVYIGDVLKAQDFAEETVGTSPVNKVSALENGCTSAIGRALADMGYAATDLNNKPVRPSREEMEKVERYAAETAPVYTQEQLDEAIELSLDVQESTNTVDLKSVYDIAKQEGLLQVPVAGSNLALLITNKKKELEKSA